MLIEIFTNNPKETQLTDQIILIYGEPKIGKTTLASQIPGVLFLATEKGFRHIKADIVEVDNPEEVNIFIDEAKKKELSKAYPVLCIDSIDALCHLSSRAICKRERAEYIGDIPHGRGWDMHFQNLRNWLASFTALGFSLVMIGHERMEEYALLGAKRNRVMPFLTGTERKAVLPICDIVAHMTIESFNDNGKLGYRRVLKCEADPNSGSGNRTKRQIGTVIVEPEETCFQRLQDAWNEGVKTNG